MKQLKPLLPFLALVGILLFAFFTRFYRLYYPSDLVFDEAYHVPAVRLIADGDPRAFEWWHGSIDSIDNYDWLHPSLAKYIQAWSYNAFGQNAFAWRLPSVIFGVAGIGLVFVVAQLAFKRTEASLLAALLLSLDGLWLVQSRLAMNDVFMVVWLLAAAASYLWYQRQGKAEWLLLVGLFGGLGLATKWSAGFWLAGLLIWELLATLRQKMGRKIPWLIFSLVILPLAVYLASFTPMFLQGKNFTYFIELHRQIAAYQIYGSGQHQFQSVAWQWPLNTQPVWYWHGGENQDIWLIDNPLLSAFSIGAVCFAIGALVRRGKTQIVTELDFLLMLFAVSFLPWLASPRIAFYYHYLPAVPIVVILLARWLERLYINKTKALEKIPLWVILISLVWVFWLYYPLWLGLPTPPAFKDFAIML
jgi:dolichyl-phosphate-mannose--protein O-mannosyl transferase